MPAEVTIVMTEKRRARSGVQNDISALSLCFIAALVVIMLLFVSDELADAMALMGLYY